MGKNVGVVTKITSDSIRLLEIVPDGAGGWREREAKIQIEPLDNKSNNSFKPTPDAGCVEPNMGLVRQ